MMVEITIKAFLDQLRDCEAGLRPGRVWVTFMEPPDDVRAGVLPPLDFTFRSVELTWDGEKWYW